MTEPNNLEKIPIGQKWPKMFKNGPKTGFFFLFKKLMSLVLSGICVKWKFLWFINILEKLLAWEKPGSLVIAKNGLANEISVFFNCQYFTNRLISHFDFWNIDRHEWKEQDSLRGILKKFWFGQMSHFMRGSCKWSILGPKWGISQLWISCKSFS